MRVVVTGSRGFLVSALIESLVERGHDVTCLSRNPSRNAAVHWLEWSVDTEDYTEAHRLALRRADFLIHVAFDLSPRALRKQVNVKASRLLFEEAKRGGAPRIVFISSLSAHSLTVSRYGRQKFEIEQLLTEDWDLALRPGLIVGHGGLFDHIRETLKNIRVAPLFWGGKQPVYLVTLADVVKAILYGMEHGKTGRRWIADSQPLTMAQFYVELGRLEQVRVRLIRLPGGPVMGLLKWIEPLLSFVGVHLPLTSI